MGLFDTTSQPPLGLQASQEQRVRVVMRGGAGEKGQIVRFDLAGSDGDVTAGKLIDGKNDSPTANVLHATNSHQFGHIYAVLIEDIDDDNEGWAMLRGLVQVQSTSTSSPDNPGDYFTVGASSRAATMVQHAKAIGISREAGASAGTLIWCLFNGVEGFGVKSNS